MAEDYSTQEGYVAEADLGLGCGLPTEHAGLTEGMTVLDLGSGAGNDAFIARRSVGERGKVIGVDFTPAMIAKARANADKLGFNNVEFREGDIEHLPIGGNSVDAIVSNCVLNLVPNKAAAFAEMRRVLRPGGHFTVSDIVLAGVLPAAVQAAAEFYAGCVSGASQEADYLRGIADAGFEGVEVVKRRAIEVPDAILATVLSADEIAAYRASGTGIYSITVRGRKPGAAPLVGDFTTLSQPAADACCAPGCCA
jgi:SAM-dependent methyltransferase